MPSFGVFRLAFLLLLSAAVANSFFPTSTNAVASRNQKRQRAGPSSFLLDTPPQQDNISLENEEPLSVVFQRGVVLQRSGDYDGALKEYEFFIKAAERCGVPSSQFAEVHANIGGVHFKQGNEDLAKHHLELALGHRPIGTAYVNLALIALRRGQGTTDPATGRACLEEARSNLEKAIALDDSDESKTMARRLLEDVKVIMGRMDMR